MFSWQVDLGIIPSINIFSSLFKYIRLKEKRRIYFWRQVPVGKEGSDGWWAGGGEKQLPASCSFSSWPQGQFSNSMGRQVKARAWLYS